MPIRDPRVQFRLSATVIFTQDQREDNHKLMDIYPNGSFCEYVRPNPEGGGPTYEDA